MKVCITIDMEHDCPPYLTSYRGVEEGTPRLLELFAQEQVAATFFTTGDVARRYPQVVEQIVAGGHELGSHGDTHRRFSDMTATEAKVELAQSGQVLRHYYPVTAFRAPNLDFPEEFLPLLLETGYRVDSSQGRHKRGSYLVKPGVTSGVRRVPASLSPTPLRTPGPVRNLLCKLMSSPAVLFFHPWEFVDMTKAPIRLDCRIRTGAPALYHLRETMRYFKGQGAQFHTISALPV